MWETSLGVYSLGQSYLDLKTHSLNWGSTVWGSTVSGQQTGPENALTQLGVYSLGVYSLGVYSLGQSYLDLKTHSSNWGSTVCVSHTQF